MWPTPSPEPAATAPEPEPRPFALPPPPAEADAPLYAANLHLIRRRLLDEQNAAERARPRKQK